MNLLSEANKLNQVYHAPGDTAANIVGSLQALNGVACVLASYLRLVGTGTPTVELVCAEDSAGSTNLTVVKTMAAVPNAPQDVAYLEATIEEIKTALATAEYAGVQVTEATGTDTSAIAVLSGDVANKKAGNIADIVA